MSGLKGVIAVDQKSLIDKLQKQFTNVVVLPLTSSFPKELPLVILIDPSKMNTACQLLSEIKSQAIGSHVITGRASLHQSVSESQPQSTAFLPWCDKEIFHSWLAFLLGLQTEIHPQWFFLRNGLSKQNSALKRVSEEISCLSSWPQQKLTTANLAEEIKCSPRYLTRILPENFGVSPGRLLRALTIFTKTAQLMHEEAQLPWDKRRGLSPLTKVEESYPKRLKKTIGMTYSELLLQAENEHWVAAWMRGWRHQNSESEVMRQKAPL
jgi:AraC-like DNA-binding protein